MGGPDQGQRDQRRLAGRDAIALDLRVCRGNSPPNREDIMLKTIAAGAAALAVMAGSAGAQDYPNRPITVVVPYAAGGPVDTVARIITTRMSELLGQQMIVENAGGAGGMTGSARVAKAAPDGYTILLSGSAV